MSLESEAILYQCPFLYVRIRKLRSHNFICSGDKILLLFNDDNECEAGEDS